MTSNQNKKQTPFDIAIVGSGLAGSAMAMALAKFMPGLKIGLIERGVFSWQIHKGRAYAMSAGSMELWYRLGFEEGLKGKTQPITDIEITDTSLETPFRASLLDIKNQLDGSKPATQMLEHEVIGPLLEKAIKNEKQIEIIENFEVASYEADQTGAVITDKAGRKINASLVIGADGRRSQMRRLARIKVFESTYDQDGLVMTVQLAKPHQGKAVQHFLPSGPFAILPLTGDRASLVWTEKRNQTETFLNLDKKALEAEIEKRFSPRLGAIKLLSKPAGFPLNLIIARQMVADRLALIGDAAHGVHPIAGQGLNLGLRDVAALTEILAERARLGLDIGGGTALDAYNQWRRFDSVSSGLVMDGLNRFFSNDQVFLRQFRTFGLRLVDHIGPLKAHFVNEAAGLSGQVPALMCGKEL